MKDEWVDWRLEIFKFKNGNIAVFDDNGIQIVNLQGRKKIAIPKIIKYLENKLKEQEREE